MKRFLMIMLALLAFMTALSGVSNVFAQEDCPCGTDDDGECIPCEEE